MLFHYQECHHRVMVLVVHISFVYLLVKLYQLVRLGMDPLMFSVAVVK